MYLSFVEENIKSIPQRCNIFRREIGTIKKDLKEVLKKR